MSAASRTSPTSHNRPQNTRHNEQGDQVVDPEEAAYLAAIASLAQQHEHVDDDPFGLNTPIIVPQPSPPPLSEEELRAEAVLRRVTQSSHSGQGELEEDAFRAQQSRLKALSSVAELVPAKKAKEEARRALAPPPPPGLDDPHKTRRLEERLARLEAADKVLAPTLSTSRLKDDRRTSLRQADLVLAGDLSKPPGGAGVKPPPPPSAKTKPLAPPQPPPPPSFLVAPASPVSTVLARSVPVLQSRPPSVLDLKGEWAEETRPRKLSDPVPTRPYEPCFPSTVVRLVSWQAPLVSAAWVALLVCFFALTSRWSFLTAASLWLTARLLCARWTDMGSLALVGDALSACRIFQFERFSHKQLMFASLLAVLAGFVFGLGTCIFAAALGLLLIAPLHLTTNLLHRDPFLSLFPSLLPCTKDSIAQRHKF